MRERSASQPERGRVITLEEAVPSGRIGRYEVVREIGTGGMASVYLAKTEGPAGFCKWFAIKRIHPHLAKDRRFVEMFLDEGRIAAAVEHPNVAHVFDLGHDGEDYYLAMEYLNGEHLGSVMRRAAHQLGRLPITLAARIVASACDGLHHAHDAKDAKGEPLGLVHRDVSPQNIFITYDGTVKLTDFGVAKAHNRITHTKTGGVKGKFSYMSPEQALGQDIDRRSDIFALGIVLWEATTSRRLFKAESDAQTLMRITSGRARAPTEVDPDFPPELERIVLRALQRKRAVRYPTAAAMARDLDRFLASRSEPAGAAELSRLMRELFAARMVAKEKILRGDTLELPADDVADDSAEPGETLPAEPSQSEIVVKSRVSVAPLPRRSRAPWIVAAVGAVVVAGLALLSSSGGGATTVRVDSEPRGASVFIDGVPQRESTPTLIEGVKQGRHTLRLVLDGHAPLEARFEAEGTRADLRHRLRALPRSRAIRAASAVESRPTAPAAPAPAPATAEPARVAPETAPAAGTTRRADPAYLNVLARPWASVTINGRPAGTTPLLRREVPSGVLVVRLRREGTGPDKVVRMRARPGETVSVREDLE